MAEQKKSEKRKRPLHRGEIKGEHLPNDYKKGNRSDSRRETSHLQAINALGNEMDSEIKKQAMKFLEARKALRKYTQEYLTKVYENVKCYIDSCADDEAPLTISGLILNSGLSKDSWDKAKKGEYDYLLGEFFILNQLEEKTDGYIDGIPYMEYGDRNILLITYCELIEKCLMMVEEQTERRLYMKGRVGDIFALKSKHDWQEEKSPQTVNQTLVIASEEQARKAIEALK